MPSKNLKVPLPRDGVWHPDYKNGEVLAIDWEAKIVFVEFYNDGQQVEIELELFYDNWWEGFNQWLLY